MCCCNTCVNVFGKEVNSCIANIHSHPETEILQTKFLMNLAYLEALFKVEYALKLKLCNRHEFSKGNLFDCLVELS